MARKIVAELMSHQSSSLVKEKQLLIAAIVGCENPPPPHSFLIILGQKDALMPNCWHIWAGNGLFSMGDGYPWCSEHAPWVHHMVKNGSIYNVKTLFLSIHSSPFWAKEIY